MKERFTIKHDTAENWAKAINFIPLKGELILYDGIIEDGNYIELPKLKIGDGITKIIDLPFIETNTNKNSYKYNTEAETIELL